MIQKGRKLLLFFLPFLTAFTSYAQETSSVFNFLKIPVSAHTAALGGDNSTIIEDDATLIFHNPALIMGVTDRTLNLNVMTYMQGSTTASAVSMAQAVSARTDILLGKTNTPSPPSRGKIGQTDPRGTWMRGQPQP